MKDFLKLIAAIVIGGLIVQAIAPLFNVAIQIFLLGFLAQ